MSVCKYPGGVFTSCPESYVINHDSQDVPQVCQLSFAEWKSEMLNQTKGLCYFTSLTLKLAMRLIIDLT